MTSGQNPIKVFISFAPKDEKYLDELLTHLTVLRRQKLIDPWHRGQLDAGAQLDQVDARLRAADLILLLISANFMANDQCFDYEMVQAMEQLKNGQSRVIPILVQSVDYKETPFAKLAPLPRSERPIATSDKRDDAWFEVVKGIRQVVDSLRADPPRPQAAPLTPGTAGGAGKAQSDAATAAQPTTASLRSVLDALFLTSDDLEVFIIDNFPGLMRHMSPNASQLARVNLLLQLVEKPALLKALSETVPAFKQHRHRLQYEA